MYTTCARCGNQLEKIRVSAPGKRGHVCRKCQKIRAKITADKYRLKHMNKTSDEILSYLAFLVSQCSDIDYDSDYAKGVRWTVDNVKLFINALDNHLLK